MDFFWLRLKKLKKVTTHYIIYCATMLRRKQIFPCLSFVHNLTQIIALDNYFPKFSLTLSEPDHRNEIISQQWTCTCKINIYTHSNKYIYSRKHRDWCPDNTVRISAPGCVDFFIVILGIHDIFFWIICHHVATLRRTLWLKAAIERKIWDISVLLSQHNCCCWVDLLKA